MKVTIYAILAFMLLGSSTCKKEQETYDVKKQLVGKWKYTGESGGYAGKEENAVQFDAAADPHNKGSIITLRNDSLTIADNVYDGFTSGYVRIK